MSFAVKRSPWFVLLGAFLVAEVLYGIVIFFVPDTLSAAPREVIGMPAYFNFNVDKRFYLFYLQVFLVPALTAALFSIGYRGAIPFTPANTRPFVVAGAELFRTIFLGAVLAIGTLKFPPLVSSVFLYQLLFFGTAYAAAVYTLARGMAVPVARLNVFAAPLVLFLPAVAASTSAVHSSEQSFALPTWFPFGLSAALVALAYVGIARREKDERLERAVLLYVVCPTLLFVVKSEIISIHALIDFTHDGEYLVSGDLFSKGLFPWRDFNLVRGLLGECLRPWLGFQIFGNSIWGVKAAESLIWQPVLYVLRYFLILYVTRGNLFLLFLAAFIFQEPHPQLFSLGYVPLTFQPLIWVAFFELLRRRSRPWAVGFATLAFFSGFVSLEAAAGVFATSAVLFFADRRRFWQTTYTYLAWLALAVLFLDYHGALGPYWRDLLASVGLRRYMHGYAVEWWLGPEFCVGVFLPAICVLYVFGRLFLKHKQGRALDYWDWGMAAVALFVLQGYQKFLGTPDGHLWEITAECLPIVLWAVLPFFRYRVTYAVVATVVAVMYPYSPARRVQELTHQYQRYIDKPSPIPKIGLLGSAPAAEAVVRDFGRVFDGRVAKGDAVYDLTNSKGLFYYLLEQKPLGRFAYTGHQLAAQREVIETMKLAPPKLVIYSGGRFWNQGGIPNSVRYWAVSEYLLEHYEPLVVMHSYLVLQRKSADHASSPSLYSFVPACDWGYAPYLFRTARAGKSLGLDAKALDLVHPEAVRALDIDFDETVDDEIILRGAGKQEIKFKTEAGGPSTVRLNVASCPQWQLFSGGKIVLEHAGGQRIAGVSVIK